MGLSRVLCIDDDLPILMALRHFDWAAYGCEWAGEAKNGRDALQAVDSLRPDIALVDVVMPVMDGLDFICLAKERAPGLAFIIVTAYCDFDYARKALRYGVTEYLTKGEYTDEELGAVLRRLSGPAVANQQAAYRYEVQRALQAVRERLGEDITLELLAQEIGLSTNYLGSLFTQQTGMRFRDYLCAARMERARELLQHTSLKVYEVAQQVGIRNAQYFSSLYQKHFGLLPGQTRR